MEASHGVKIAIDWYVHLEQENLIRKLREEDDERNEEYKVCESPRRNEIQLMVVAFFPRHPRRSSIVIHPCYHHVSPDRSKAHQPSKHVFPCSDRLYPGFHTQH